MNILLENGKATFNYEIGDKLDAGIELFGFEVKALRAKRGSLEGSHVTIRGGEAFLIGASIPAYQPKNTPAEYEPERNRRLLLTKEEIASLSGGPGGKKLAGSKGGKGGKGKDLTIIPLLVYSIGRKIKVKIGVAKGKKKFDKRETIKRRETDRDLRREFKDR